ncbi:MAG: BCCT family transporter [Bacillota bacterium]|nr:BCCT family transporter [Bacillota bacterium]
MKQWMEHVDKKVAGIGGFICLVFVAWALIFREQAERVLGRILSIFSTDFGWLYLMVVVFFIGFLFWICCSKYGSIRLGKDDDRPEYSTLSWFFMLFAAGMGIGLVFWSVAEPMSHYLYPPYGEGSTVESASLAMRYTFTHWGLHPWACYGVVGLALAYFQFRKNQPALLSSCFIPLVGEKHANGLFGSIINILAVVATVFGVATSLGMGAMQINSGLQYAFGIPYGNGAMIAIIAITTCLFIASSVSGIDKGIRFLSNTNMVIFFVLLLFVFLVGPTLFQINFFTDSLGQYLSSLVSTSFWTDPFNQSDGWLGSWTVFYWAWWISWGPFVGGFIARISKGRTIREFVIGTLLAPVILSFIFMCVMGGTAIHLDMSGVSGVATAMGENVSYALFALLEQLPCTELFSILSIILISVFFITSADSSTFVCAMMTSRGIQNPSPHMKILWGLAEGAIAAVLLLAGGLSALQSASIAAALPFIFVCLGIIAALMKALKQDPLIISRSHSDR